MVQPYKIIYTNCTNIPFCFHVAVTCMYNGKVFVFHNTPTLKNKFGGNVVCQSIEDFLKDRKINKSRDCKINLNNILQNFDEVKYKKWDGYNFNCETYVNQLLYNCNGTTQLENLCNIALITVCLL